MTYTQFIGCVSIYSFIAHVQFISKWNFLLAPFTNEPLANWIELLLKENGNLFQTDLIRNEFLVYVVVTLDTIWNTRNTILHDPNCTVNLSLIQDISKRIEIMAQAHWRIQLSKIISEGNKSSPLWKPPPKN